MSQISPFELTDKKYSKIPKLTTDQEFWDTDKSYDVFYRYLKQGPNRRLSDIWMSDPKYTEGKPIPSTWKNWQRFGRWGERCEAWDIEQGEIANAARKEVLIRQQEQDLESLKAFQKTTGIALKSTSIALLKKFKQWAADVSFEKMEVTEVLRTFKAMTEAIELSEDLISKSIGLEEILELINNEGEDGE
jgi:hypothetical protein